MRSIPSYLNKLDRQKEYIFVCRSGNRSHRIACLLKEHGFDNVHNFSGGMLTWDDEVQVGLENIVDHATKL